jgi:hypothetical protein
LCPDQGFCVSCVRPLVCVGVNALVGAICGFDSLKVFCYALLPCHHLPCQCPRRPRKRLPSRSGSPSSPTHGRTASPSQWHTPLGFFPRDCLHNLTEEPPQGTRVILRGCSGSSSRCTPARHRSDPEPGSRLHALLGPSAHAEWRVLRCGPRLRRFVALPRLAPPVGSEDDQGGSWLPRMCCGIDGCTVGWTNNAVRSCPWSHRLVEGSR